MTKSEYHRTIAKITSAKTNLERGLCLQVCFDLPNGGICSVPFLGFEPSGPALNYILSILRGFKVDDLSELVGKNCFVLFDKKDCYDLGNPLHSPLGSYCQGFATTGIKGDYIEFIASDFFTIEKLEEAVKNAEKMLEKAKTKE